MMGRRSDDATEQWLREVESVMRGIERSVMGEMFLSRRLMAMFLMVAGALLAAIVAARQVATVAERPLLPTISLLVSGVVVAATVGGILSRRFFWTCVNVLAAGVSLVLSMLAFWILRTGAAVVGAGWFAVAALCEAVLVLRWSATALTPMSKSQPECRAARHAGLG